MSFCDDKIKRVLIRRSNALFQIFAPILLATLPYGVNHQVRMEVTSNGEHVLMNPCGYEGVMIYDLFPPHGASNVRLIHVGRTISGYEFVPGSLVGSNDRLYVSSHDATAPYAGGIEYFDFATGSGPTVPFTYSSHQVFGFTEIELAKNGLLYFAYNPTFGSGFVIGAGDLYYFDPSWANTSSPVQAAAGGEVSTYFNWGYYVQRQIDGEDYDATSYAVQQPDFDINGVSNSGGFVDAIFVCDSSMNLSTIINSYHTSYTVKVEVGTVGFLPPSFTPDVSQPSGNTLTIYNSNTLDVLNLLTTFPWLYTMTGKGLRVMVTVNGCGSAYKQKLYYLQGFGNTIADYGLRKYNGGSPDYTKAVQKTLPITTLLPAAGSNIGQFRANIDNAKGWVGANATMEIGDININISSTVIIKVYQVDDTTGERKIIYDTTYIGGNPVITSDTAPNIYDDTVAASSVQGGNIRFNDQTRMFDDTNPPYYYNDNPGNSAKEWFDYFRDYYQWAYTNSALNEYSSRVYRIDFTVTTSTGCVKTNTSYFKIANNGLASGFGARPTSINEIDNMDVSIYPNPVDDKLSIHIPFAWEKGEIIVTNTLGQTIIQETLTGNPIEVKRLTSGVYIYHLTVDGVKYDGKLIKN